MADVNFAADAATARSAAPAAPAPDAATIDFELIELLFFAYRDFVGEPDQTLARFGFGRAHHRVLHFVTRNPGLRVTDLLETLRITKQSLGRVLKELVDKGFVEQEQGAVDRRQRLLHATERGRALALDLSARQSARLARALSGLPPEARGTIRDFLARMIDTDAPRGATADDGE